MKSSFASPIMLKGRPHTDATDARVMPWVAQYLDWSQLARCLVPLLALHPMQHRAMFSRVTTLASLMMCSHDGRLRRTRNRFGEFDSTVDTATVVFNDLGVQARQESSIGSWCIVVSQELLYRSQRHHHGQPEQVADREAEGHSREPVIPNQVRLPSGASVR